MNIDYESYVSRADLYYDKPVKNSWDGLPIGNGRMGTVVWTTPRTVNFQINRVDVFATNSATTAADFRMDSKEYYGINEYCGGCGGIEIDFGGDIAPDGRLAQHLSFYHAVARLECERFAATIFIDAEVDVMAVDCRLKSEETVPLRIRLKLLRDPLVRKNAHTARSRFENAAGEAIGSYNHSGFGGSSRGNRSGGFAGSGGCYGVEQVFEERCDTGIGENDHYCQSAMMVSIARGRVTDEKQVDDKTLELTVEQSVDGLLLFISSAASMEGGKAKVKKDAMKTAARQLGDASRLGIDGMLRRHREWWHDFWSRSFIHVPDFPLFDLYWITHLYYMGSCMRGDYPAKFNGLIWTTQGDLRFWGAQYWWFNTGRSQYPVEKAGHGELNRPLYLKMHAAMERYRRAARQQWKCEGMYFPETEAFDGPEILPDDIAEELHNLLLFHKPVGDRFRDFLSRRSGMNSRWALFLNKKHMQKGMVGACGWHSNLLYNAGDVANLMWEHYQHTGDEEFLKEYAYPLMREVAEFYRTFPGMYEEEDGKYHLHETGWSESIMAARDIIDDLAVIRGLYPTVITVSERLGVDEELRPKWRRILDNLAPYPTGSMTDALIKTEHPGGHETYAVAREQATGHHSNGCSNDCRLRMLLLFDLVNLETRAIDPDTWELTMHSLEAHVNIKSILNGAHPTHHNWGYVWNRTLVKAARMGRTDLVGKGLPLMLRQFTIPNHYHGVHKNWYYPNRMPWTGELQSPSLQETGVLAECLQEPLLQSPAPGPGTEPVIHVLPAWPAEWDVVFKLHAKGGYTVAASQKSGKLEWIEIRASRGGLCRIHNPWGSKACRIRRSNGLEEVESAVTLAIDMKPGERLILMTDEAGQAAQAGSTAVPAAAAAVSAAHVPDKITFKAEILTDTVSVRLPYYDRMPVLAPNEETKIAVSGNAVDVRFESSDPNVASVDERGMVRGVGPGKTVIQALAGGTELCQLPLIVRHPVINDFDPGIRYTGDWKTHWYMLDKEYFNDPKYMERKRPWFDDYHYTETAGSSFEYEFDAEAIELIGITGPSGGRADVFLDGKLISTINGKQEHKSVGTVLYRRNSLSRGPHTIKVVNKSGRLVLDAIILTLHLDRP